MPRVAIVIVTYNSASEVGGCLDALTGLAEVEIVVVDNASADSTRDEVEHRGVRLIANAGNAGFAAGVNQGIRATTAPLILLLNPDAHLVRGLEAMADRLETPGTGAVGGMLVDADGKPQAGFMARNLPTPAILILEVFGINHFWPTNPLNWHYRCMGLHPMTAGLVDQPAGAFLMFRRTVWEQLGGFDERFWPIWFEDVDFCARVKSVGYRTYYDPAGVAKHSGSHSIHALPLENRQRYWYGSLLEYAAKHYSFPAFRTTCVGIAVGAALRGIFALPRKGFAAFVVYGGVVGLALNRLFRRRASVVRIQLRQI
jgi:N-acetylglucosaminyl-diphospho-decaprenol L-rhamnosyltransferase